MTMLALTAVLHAHLVDPDFPGYVAKWRCDECAGQDDGRFYEGHCLSIESAERQAAAHDRKWHA